MGKLIKVDEERIVTGVTIQLTIQELATITEAIGQSNADKLIAGLRGMSNDVEKGDMLRDTSPLYKFLSSTYKEAKQ